MFGLLSDLKVRPFLELTPPYWDTTEWVGRGGIRASEGRSYSLYKMSRQHAWGGATSYRRCAIGSAALHLAQH